MPPTAAAEPLSIASAGRALGPRALWAADLPHLADRRSRAALRAFLLATGWAIEERHRRARLGRSVVDACRERLAAGASVGLYPEGTRNRRPGRLLRGRSGLGWLVLGSTAPVVPVGIRFPAAERLGRTPLLGRIAVRIDDPLTFAPERAAHAAQIAHAAPAASAAGAAVLGAPGRRLARRVVAAVMAELAALSDRTPGVRPPRPSASPNPPPTPDWRAVQ